jgi:hypothetical protein
LGQYIYVLGEHYNLRGVTAYWEELLFIKKLGEHYNLRGN